MWGPVKGFPEILTNPVIGPSIYLLDANFQLLGICCSRLYLEETNSCLVQDPIGPILGGLGGNNSSKQRQTELKF